MAGWLSSKLKVAEQFLQQIDQHAAESLGNVEKQSSDNAFTSNPEERNKNRIQGSFKNKHGDQFGHGFQEENYLISSEFRIPTTPVYVQKEAGHGKMPLLRQGFHEENHLISSDIRIPTTSVYGKREAGYGKRPLSREQNAREIKHSFHLANREDWTELLASTDLSSSSFACTSSVGSSDTADIRDVPSRTPFFTGQSGSYAEKMENSKSVTKPIYSHLSSSEFPSLLARIKSGKEFSEDEETNFEKEKRIRSLAHDGARRHLDLDTKSIESLGSGSKEPAVTDAASKTKCLGFEEDKQRDILYTNKKSVLTDKEPIVSSITSTFKDTEDRDANLEMVSGTLTTHIPGTLGRSSSLEAQNVADIYQKEPWSMRLQHEVDSAESLLKSDNVHLEVDLNGCINPSTVTKEEPGIVLAGAEKHMKRENGISSNNFTMKQSEFIEQDIGVTVDAEANLLPNLQAEKQAYKNRLVQVPDELSIVNKSVNLVSISGSDLETTGSRRETDTEATSNSRYEDAERQNEIQRTVKQKALTAAAVRAAEDAISVREDFVEKLEKEKQMLEQTLVEYEEKQIKLATELHMSMMEVADALELEKHQHSLARMKTLARESQLENENAKLAKSLAAAQRMLEEKISEVAKARDLVEAKEIVHTDFERRIATLHRKLVSQNVQQREIENKANLEEPSFEQEQTNLWQKIQQCQIKVKEIEDKIGALKRQYARTDSEIQLEARLAQLADQLIQKQTQVEALSTEKATLVFRLEALSGEYENEKSFISLHAPRNARGIEWSTFCEDLEHGYLKPGHSKNKLFLSGSDKRETRNSGISSHHFLSLFRQLDILFSAGIYYVRKHRWAQVFLPLYLLLLHLWVVFVLFMHSQPDIPVGSRVLLLPLVTVVA